MVLEAGGFMIREIEKKSSNVLEIISENGKSHSLNFNSKIWSFLKTPGGIIVLLEPTEEIQDQNIKKFDESGNCIWTVGKPSATAGIRYSTFTYIGFDAAGNLLGGSLNDYTYKIDINTGRLLDREYRK